MTYNELYDKTKAILEELGKDRVDDFVIGCLAFCKNEEDLKLLYDFLTMSEKGKDSNVVTLYSVYLHTKRNDPERAQSEEKFKQFEEEQ